MSNPYDPNQNPGQYPGQPPPYGSGDQGGGTPNYPEYGGAPYGGQQPPKTDAVSITGFVLSLTCCLSIIGVILGLVGLVRTKQGQRKGRWAAISAIAIGIPLTLVAVAGGIIFGIALANSVTPGNAEAGQCVDVSDDNGNISMTKKDCAEKHDAEIVAVQEARDTDADLGSFVDAQQICTAFLDPLDAETVAEGYDWSIVIEDPNKIDDSDKFVCYVEPTSGDKLTDKVLP